MTKVIMMAMIMAKWNTTTINVMMIIIVATLVTAIATQMIILTFNYLQPIKPMSNGI